MFRQCNNKHNVVRRISTTKLFVFVKHYMFRPRWVSGHRCTESVVKNVELSFLIKKLFLIFLTYLTMVVYWKFMQFRNNYIYIYIYIYRAFHNVEPSGSYPTGRGARCWSEDWHKSALGHLSHWTPDNWVLWRVSNPNGIQHKIK